MFEYAILTLLREGADHGYRLKQRLDDLLAPVWQVNVGQVYQVLDRLRRKRWVEELPPERLLTGGRERWPVAITPEGRAELERWTASPIPPSRPPTPKRNDLLTRLVFAGEPCIEQLLRDLAGERHAYTIEHHRITALRDRLPESGSTVDIAKRLALESARIDIRAHVEWVDLCLTRLGGTANASAPLPKRTCNQAPR